MAQVTARTKVKGKHYEILVELDEALKVRAGKGDIMSALVTPQIFSDIKKGLHVPKSELIESFGTDNLYEIAKKIMVSGEVQKTQEFRDAERETKIKQTISILLRNAVDQNGRPYTEERLKRAIEESRFVFDNRPPEQQVADLLNKLKTVIPIKVEMKRVQLIIPARFTGSAYALLKEYKESEEWLSNGDLQVIMQIPAGMQLDFYDKLNAITHGAVQSKELPQNS